jgi:Raf kinase inhibitor-like YbhB/YbcL family protein
MLRAAVVEDSAIIDLMEAADARRTKDMARSFCEGFHKVIQILLSARCLGAVAAGWMMVSACAAQPQQDLATAMPGASDGDREGGPAMAFRLESGVFEGAGAIPSKFTCDGQDVSPPLTWSGVPEGTISLALIMDDPDAPAGIWVHWVLYGIPASEDGLGEGVPADDVLPDGARSGLNSWRRSGYGGPCPPGGTHRYFFRLYALDSVLELSPGATKEALLEAMQGHILGQTELMGTYSRSG